MFGAISLLVWHRDNLIWFGSISSINLSSFLPTTFLLFGILLIFTLPKDEEIHVARSLRSRHIICFELSRKSCCMEFKMTERGGESGLSDEIRRSRRKPSSQTRYRQEQKRFPYPFTVKLRTGFSAVGKAMPMTPSGNGIGLVRGNGQTIKEDSETVVGKSAPVASTAHRLDRARRAPN